MMASSIPASTLSESNDFAGAAGLVYWYEPVAQPVRVMLSFTFTCAKAGRVAASSAAPAMGIRSFMNELFAYVYGWLVARREIPAGGTEKQYPCQIVTIHVSPA